MLDRIRYFNKRVINRVLIRFAGMPHSPFSLVRHVGRRSAKAYQTPIMVAPSGDGFIFCLTYGPNTDWYRNIVAAGHAMLRSSGKEYRIDNPKMIDASTGRAAFGIPAKYLLRLLGVRYFFHMEAHIVAQ